VDTDRIVRLGIYQGFAACGKPPAATDLSETLGIPRDEVVASLRRLAAARAVVLEADGATIRMALPFSAVPTAHIVESGVVRYYANCAWDALGIPAALKRPAVVRSRCGMTHEGLRLEVNGDSAPLSTWLFHTPVRASRWWDDIVET
jgi:hypothetical protein